MKYIAEIVETDLHKLQEKLDIIAKGPGVLISVVWSESDQGYIVIYTDSKSLSNAEGD